MPASAGSLRFRFLSGVRAEPVAGPKDKEDASE
jgi:hypothetical protein